jgi:hypothetical protein
MEINLMNLKQIHDNKLKMEKILKKKIVIDTLMNPIQIDENQYKSLMIEPEYCQL